MGQETRDENAAPRRLRRRWLAVGAVVTLLATAGTFLYEPAAALGVALGGAAGTLTFGLLARQMAALKNLPPAQVAAQIYRGVFLRLLVYGAVFALAYTLDRENLHALIGAAAGVLLVRFAVVLSSAAEARRAIKRLSE